MGIALVTLYVYRKSRAYNQYVHRDSHAVVSIALDDLLLDNIGQLFERRTLATANQKSPLSVVKNWLEAGVSIPAQIHFFSLRENPLTFYTIQRIENIGKWEAFLQEYAADYIQTVDSSERLTLVQSPSLPTILSNEHYALFRIGLPEKDSEEKMKAIWSIENDWVYVRNLPLLSTEKTNTHITYRDIDGKSQLLANLSKNHITLAGEWEFNAEHPSSGQVRKLKRDADLFLLFWSTLSLEQMPTFTKYISVLSGIEETILKDNSYGYTDLVIRNRMTTQKDTIVVYDYDEDFNSIEKKEIQETSVPVIESVWKGNVPLASLLPDKVFYKLNKTHTDTVILLSTDKRGEFPPTFVATAIPFHIQVDFSNTPDSWNGQILTWLHQRAVKVNIETSLKDNKTLKINGDIYYKEK